MATIEKLKVSLTPRVLEAVYADLTDLLRDARADQTKAGKRLVRKATAQIRRFNFAVFTMDRPDRMISLDDPFRADPKLTTISSSYIPPERLVDPETLTPIEPTVEKMDGLDPVEQERGEQGRGPEPMSTRGALEDELQLACGAIDYDRIAAVTVKIEAFNASCPVEERIDLDAYGRIAREPLQCKADAERKKQKKRKPKIEIDSVTSEELPPMDFDSIPGQHECTRCGALMSATEEAIREHDERKCSQATHKPRRTRKLGEPHPWAG